MMEMEKTETLWRRQEAALEVAEKKMLKVSLGLTRMERNRNENLKGITCVRCSGGKCFRYVQGRDKECNVEVCGARNGLKV